MQPSTVQSGHGSNSEWFNEAEYKQEHLSGEANTTHDMPREMMI